MTFVVTEPCIACKHTSCVDVCPMDCFVEGPNFVAIDPTECIDCSVCVPECPVDAIVHEADVPEDQRHFIDLNARVARDPAWRSITRSRPPLPDHARWAEVHDKAHLIEWPAP